MQIEIPDDARRAMPVCIGIGRRSCDLGQLLFFFMAQVLKPNIA